MSTTLLGEGQSYHFHCLYNYAKGGPFSKTDDTRQSTYFTEKLVSKLSGWGYTKAYYYDRDSVPGRNKFDEQFRIIEESKWTIVVLTPDFLTNCWTRYCEQLALHHLLDQDSTHLLIPLALNLRQTAIPRELCLQDVLYFDENWEECCDDEWKRLRIALRDDVQVRHVTSQYIELHQQGAIPGSKPPPLNTAMVSPLHHVTCSANGVNSAGGNAALNASMTSSHAAAIRRLANQDSPECSDNVLRTETRGHPLTQPASDTSLSSLVEDMSLTDSCANLTEVLDQLQSQLNDDKISKFNITRSDVLEGAKRSIRRKKFSPNNKMSVRFTDTFGIIEGAIDEGGPKREFLRMLMFQVQHLPVFEGPENARLLSCNAGALHDELFKDVGVFIALSLCHGGPAPKFFSDILYNHLVYGLQKTRQGLKIEHIVDEGLREQVSKLQMASSLDNLRKMMNDMATLLNAAGCYRHISNLQQKERLVEEFTTFLILGRTNIALQGLAKGLETLQLLPTMRKYPDIMRPLFVCNCEEKLTADVLEVIFKDIKYSPQGSNARVKEEKCISFWRDFIIDIEEEEDSPMKLTDILIFATGADQVPPLGFSPDPSIKFTPTLLPEANTCAFELRLPLHDTYIMFKEKMAFGIMNSRTFGRA